MSVADVAVGVHIARCMVVEELTSAFPAIGRYHARLLEAPAYRKNVQEPLVG